RAVRSDVAMTGEITLHGTVLPIGGLKEKTMAAYREKMTTVIVPADNMSDLYEVDATVKDALHFIPVTNLKDALKISLLSPETACQTSEQ
ncbi:MAG: S16 family serine protease, partial [Pygmaiobacter sp.]